MSCGAEKSLVRNHIAWQVAQLLKYTLLYPDIVIWTQQRSRRQKLNGETLYSYFSAISFPLQ